MGIPVAFPISGAKQNTQTKNFIGHPDRHTWQYFRSLWFSVRSVRRSDILFRIFRKIKGDNLSRPTCRQVVSLCCSLTVYNIWLFVPRFRFFCVIFKPNCLPLSSEIFWIICQTVGPSGQKITRTGNTAGPAMFSNINTRNGRVDASQPV
jgi:hypothetical protein